MAEPALPALQEWMLTACMNAGQTRGGSNHAHPRAGEICCGRGDVSGVIGAQGGPGNAGRQGYRR